jgi:type IV pilus assembly protein PilP
VEEASGKGYIISRGTYIGIHSGQVVEIQEDGVIVEERHEDMYGDVDIRRRELKFQRPSGDEIL